ncbi:MAG: type VI secretion system tip protein VgrG [Phycisphaerales bacterium]|nr:type VI secretion system tip protein VgrG [Phycisphaerales bacterium]MCI0674749.1 type VI secretion system tip protein VgrG [Phycisphaerales bacterium]
MATYTQENRRLAIETPLGKDALLLSGFSGTEEISRLFSFNLEMLSERGSIPAKDIVGKNVTFALELMDEDHTQRFFNGYVRRFTYRGKDDRLHRYTAEVVPWLWFLTRTTDCRIFPPNKTAPQIIEQVFTDLGFTEFETTEIKGKHPEREYCVQYRESDFDFVSRLMEEEGIFYYFRHENGKHVLVLADGKAAYKDCPESQVEFKSTLSAPEWGDLITGWEHQYEFRSGKFAQTDYNFEAPTAPMLSSSPTVLKLDNVSAYELFDYPGKHVVKDDGDTLAKIRMEQEEIPHDVVRGASKCRSFFTGGRFTMAAHHDPAEEGKSYVITSVHHSAAVEGFETGSEDSNIEYSNTFTCIPDSLTFRPARLTPKPLVHGSQTAIVVGPSGEEIYTDKFGRVKVHFHWDRYNKPDENSSCWVRVSQTWAGKQWGAMFIPRIGQEVIVDFLEGDPDRPIITGRVYHAESMPPYELPTNMTMSTIKTSSSKGGEGFNEIRFEDKKGDEQIFIHGEKNQDIRIKNDCFEWIGNNRHLFVVKDQYEKVDNNRHEMVTNDHMEEIGKDRHLKVVGKEAKEVGESQSLTVKGDVIEVFKGKQSTDVTGDLYIKGMNVVIEATANLTLKVGGNSVVLSPASVVATSSAMLGMNGSIVLINSGGSGAAGSGQAGSAVAPAAPTEPEEADVADPGQVAEAKAEQIEQEKGKYGAVPVTPHKPPKTAEEKAKKTSWVEIKLVDVEGEPVPGEAFNITLPDGSVSSGTLDEKGFARVEGFDPGSCKVTFPNLDKSVWNAKA